ncbi:MAG: NTP transferase domain-containing protein [Thermoplasmata archaeon]|nr:molybdenum cofactor guanylyltransferase [Thermoplasmata archaeon]NIS11806.1 molybdenum cofactor guanylyltransferase [Thermoplasmata archaeon]NIS19691.1 molybdenum cofactor guanylyltransferase [Thermoplasmata archaeon]NIT76873.1 molybdenum cofactor guanylyltransferase [Thermoplasmata archaeon]NIU48802.1 molybdenum cofactor guanylyltransferase [Thermoplasmata archaeon]
MQAGVILAGGRFARFGRDKNLAPLGGKPLIWWTAQALTSAGNVIIAANNWAQAEKYLKIVGVGATAALDPVPSQGAAGGLLQGLRSTYADNVAVCYADTPFVVWGIYCKLFEEAKGHDGAVVEAKGKRRYNLAVVSRLPAIKALKSGVEAGTLDLESCLKDLDLAVVPEEDILELDPDLDCLIDVDTEGDLRMANKVLERRESEADRRKELECDL